MGMFDKIFGGEKHSVDRFVGGTKKGRKEVGKQLDRRFRDQERFEAIKPYEREKTPAEKEAIRLANEATDALREKYGLPAYEVPEKNIHIVRDVPESRKELGKEGVHGKFNEMAQVIISLERSTRTQTLHGIFHEMAHFKSFTSMVVDEEEKTIAGRRMGLTTRDNENRTAFMPLNEAVTEELTKRFIRAQEDDHADDHDIKNLRTARKKYPSEDTEDIYSVTVEGKTESGGVKLDFNGFGYRVERKALGILIDKLKERNPKTFRDKEEWFDMFASAMFNGHLLEIARSIEGTFGKGKFRELGEQKTGEELLKFVESL